MSRLRKVDRVLAPVAWAGAAVVVVMLLAGPAVIANDKKSGASTVYGSGTRAGGATVFKANCGSCHTLSAAGTTGTVGPSLDNVSLSRAEVEAKVRTGGGAMPPFSGKLSAKEIKAVAAYVSSPR